MRFFIRSARPARKNHTVTGSTNLSGGTRIVSAKLRAARRSCKKKVLTVEYVIYKS
jgi:hypothetical protein